MSLQYDPDHIVVGDRIMAFAEKAVPAQIATIRDKGRDKGRGKSDERVVRPRRGRRTRAGRKSK